MGETVPLAVLAQCIPKIGFFISSVNYLEVCWKEVLSAAFLINANTCYVDSDVFFLHLSHWLVVPVLHNEIKENLCFKLGSSFVSLGAVFFCVFCFFFLSCNHFCIDCAIRNCFDALQRTARRSFAAVFILFACWPLHLLRDLLIRSFFMTDTFRPLAYFSFESCPQLYFLGSVLQSCGMLFILSVPCLGTKGWLAVFSAK